MTLTSRPLVVGGHSNWALFHWEEASFNASQCMRSSAKHNATVQRSGEVLTYAYRNTGMKLILIKSKANKVNRMDVSVTVALTHMDKLLHQYNFAIHIYGDQLNTCHVVWQILHDAFITVVYTHKWNSSTYVTIKIYIYVKIYISIYMYIQTMSILTNMAPNKLGVFVERCM